ncbi:MAG TPA: hypothetical protein VI757_03055 [Bacteroidia bacterium]|nr:hypothetical protein [Bacteroidia bacterium]
MNTKKFLLATLAAFVALFVVNSLWFGVIFKDWFMENMKSPSDENIPMHGFAELCYGALLAWIYPLGFKQGTAMSQGMKFGLLMGLVYSLPGSLHMHASMGGTWEVPCFFIANGILVSIIAGIAVAMVYGGKSSSPAAS